MSNKSIHLIKHIPSFIALTCICNKVQFLALFSSLILGYIYFIVDQSYLKKSDAINSLFQILVGEKNLGIVIESLTIIFDKLKLYKYNIYLSLNFLYKIFNILLILLIYEIIYITICLFKYYPITSVNNEFY